MARPSPSRLAAWLLAAALLFWGVAAQPAERGPEALLPQVDTYISVSTGYELLQALNSTAGSSTGLLVTLEGADAEPNPRQLLLAYFWLQEACRGTGRARPPLAAAAPPRRSPLPYPAYFAPALVTARLPLQMTYTSALKKCAPSSHGCPWMAATGPLC